MKVHFCSPLQCNTCAVHWPKWLFDSICTLKIKSDNVFYTWISTWVIKKAYFEDVSQEKVCWNWFNQTEKHK